MKIIKDNTKKGRENQNIEVKCDCCGSILEVEDNDIYIGWLGAGLVTCPCCGEGTEVECKSIVLTGNNLEFPKHFRRTNKDLPRVKELSDKEILCKIKECILFLQRNTDEDYCIAESGDSHIIVYVDGGYFSIVVSKDFYTTLISGN